MGFLDFIFGKKIKRQDEFFGEMLFLENRKNPEKNFLECRRQFAPISKDIDIEVRGDLDIRLEQQQFFFNKIEEKYDLLASKFASFVEQKIQDWRLDFQIQDFKKEFEPFHLILHRCDFSPMVWEISFTTFHEKNLIFIIKMEDFEAVELLIDD